jgi:hypothetical protein
VPLVAVVVWRSVRKRRHDNPHAERQIEALNLPRWRSRSELAAEAKALAERERERAELDRKRERAAELGAKVRSSRAAADAAAAEAVTPDGRMRAAELGAEALQAERAARVALALVPVPWDDLSPAELRWRWELAHHHADEWRPPSTFSVWAREAREAWAERQNTVATATREPSE